MDVQPTQIPDVVRIQPKVFGDERGFFSETYNQHALAERGIEVPFVQDNHSYSAQQGTIRGIHFQIPPYAQAKLVRVVRGAILDVAVDLRKGSPTFGQHVSEVISAEAWNQLLIPEGFGHAFCTLEPDTEIIYKVSDYYAPDHDRGLRWNDPDLAIDWPVAPEGALLSEKDQSHPSWSEFDSAFVY